MALRRRAQRRFAGRHRRESDPALVADWKDWQAYKRQNEDRFERIDADLLAEHIKIAEEWQ